MCRALKEYLLNVKAKMSLKLMKARLCLLCQAVMSHWLGDGLVLEGEGSGEAMPLSPRQRTLPPGSPMVSRVRSPLTSPSAREPMSGSPQTETMGKARELFVLCDKEGKGFITKRDMQVSSLKKRKQIFYLKKKSIE